MYSILKKLSAFATWMGPRGWRFWGGGFGTLLWWFLPKKRRSIMLDNLMTSLQIDEKNARHLAKVNCQNMGILIMEALALPKLTPENVSEWISIEGKEHLEEALAMNRGVIIATAHQGNWEWLGGGLALYGYPLVAVMTPQHNQEINQLIMDLRGGANMILAMRAEVRDMVRHLKEGRAVGLLMDQYAPQSDIRVSFFGRETSCQPGPAVLARLQKAPIVPIFIHRLPNGKHHITVYPLKVVDQEKERHLAQEEITRELMGIIEAYIRKHPEEWFWLHNRWKLVGRERTTS